MVGYGWRFGGCIKSSRRRKGNKHIDRTYEVPAEGIVDLSESTAQRVQLCARLTALLELALEPRKDMIKGEPALAWRSHVPAHAAHANETLGH